jgi:hypothetical protein
MYYTYVEIEYVATGFSPARTNLAIKLLNILQWLLVKEFSPIVCGRALVPHLAVLDLDLHLILAKSHIHLAVQFGHFLVM